MRMTYKVFQEYINLVSLAVYPFVSLSFVRLLVHLSTFRSSFALNVVIVYISVTTQQIFFIFGQ